MRAIEFLKESKMGGAAFKDTRAITVQEIFGEDGLKVRQINLRPTGKQVSVPTGYGTIQNISSATGLSIDYLLNNVLGSVGKKSMSNDIDIAIDTTQFGANYINELEDRLIKQLGAENVKAHNKNNGQLYTRIKIAGVNPGSVIINGTQSEFVQVDFMFGVGDLLKFSYHSPTTNESEYKGALRTQFLMRIVGNLRHLPHHGWVQFDGERLVASAGAVLTLDRGILWRYKHSFGKSDGSYDASKVIKTPSLHKDNPEEFATFHALVKQRWPETSEDDLKKGYIKTADPEDIADLIFGREAKASDLNTFENIYKIFMQSKLYDDNFKELVLRELKTTIERMQKSDPTLNMPEELQNVGF